MDKIHWFIINGKKKNLWKDKSCWKRFYKGICSNIRILEPVVKGEVVHFEAVSLWYWKQRANCLGVTENNWTLSICG